MCLIDDHVLREYNETDCLFTFFQVFQLFQVFVIFKVVWDEGAWRLWHSRGASL